MKYTQLIQKLTEVMGTTEDAAKCLCCDSRKIYYLKKGKGPLSPAQLLKLIAKLKEHQVNIYELIDPDTLSLLSDCGLGFIERKLFDSKKDFYAHISSIENQNRMVVLSRFPSDIYLNAPTTEVERSRLDKIQNGTISNQEFYPISAIINFGFSPTSKFSHTEKINILARFDKYFHKAKTNQLFFFDDKKKLFTTHSEIEILQDKKLLIIEIPSHKKDYLFFQNPELVDSLHNYFNMELALSIQSQDAHKILEYLKDSLLDGDSTDALIDFYKKCNEHTAFGPKIFKQLSPSLQAHIKNRD